jgi:hypothetical protein
MGRSCAAACGARYAIRTRVAGPVQCAQHGGTVENTATRIFVCYEPDDRVYADRLDGWLRTNVDADAYIRRSEVDVTAPEADAARSRIMAQIGAAQIVVCVISQGTARSAWVDWELKQARSFPNRKGLVGIKLSEHVRTPPAMSDCGAIFVPFRRTSVERAVEWALKEQHTRGDFTLMDE